MVAPAAGSVVLVPFPFSDLSQAKLRPAVVLASGNRNDWVLCQVTSKPYGDRRALELCDSDFVAGGLRISSFVRPAKLFTAHQSLMLRKLACTLTLRLSPSDSLPTLRVDLPSREVRKITGDNSSTRFNVVSSFHIESR